MIVDPEFKNSRSFGQIVTQLEMKGNKVILINHCPWLKNILLLVATLKIQTVLTISCLGMKITFS
jgi:hypothetical protein